MNLTNKLRTSLYTTLALLLVGAGMASPATATHELETVEGQHCDVVADACRLLEEAEFQQPTLCESSPVVCALVQEVLDAFACDVNGGCSPDVNLCSAFPDVCEAISELVADPACDVLDHWTCIDMVFGRVNEMIDRLRVLDMVDGDGDFIPDEAESEMCGRAVVRDAVQEVPYGGSCYGTTDYRGGANTVYFFVPEGVSTGSDNDGDGVPGGLQFHGHGVIFSLAGGDVLYSYPVNVWQPLDNDDYDRNTPVPRDDVDAVGEYVDQQVAAIVAEAEAAAAEVVATGEALGALLFAIVEATAAEAVQTADETATFAWNEAMNTWQPVWDTAEQAVEDAETTVWWAYNTAWRTAWDTIRTVEDLVDEDGDLFPDALEDTMCYVENTNSDLDGSCYYGDYRPPY